MPITHDPNLKPSSSIFTKGNDFIVLPFPYLRLSWNNGNAHAAGVKLAGSAQYFGGFQRGSKDIAEDLQNMSKTTLPAYFQEEEWVNDKGETYMAWGSRTIWAAPILAKVDWYEEPDKYTSEIRTKHRLDFLIYLADRETKSLTPWGPAVISSYGNAASAIEKAFKGFAQESLDARQKYADGIDTLFFYHLYGTFGNTRVTKKVSDSAAITPCFFDKSTEGWTENMLVNRFIGDDVATILIALQEAAKTWFEDTKENRQKKSGPTPAAAVPFREMPPDDFMEATPDEELPF
jgi:hypothetical protein